MNSPYYDPKLFLLEHDLEKELIQQTLELLKFIRGEHEMSTIRDKDIEQMLYDALNKYKDSESISIQAIKNRIAEQGYEYLTEIFDTSDENLRVLAAYLPMIQILKGSKPGLELIFTILNVGFEITEWWEDPSNMEILSYVLSVELINKPVTTTVIPRLKKFSREYVYPLLTNIIYSIAYQFNKAPRIAAVSYSKTALSVWQEFLWLIWSGDGNPQNLWTDQKPYQDPIRHKSYWQGGTDIELEWGSTKNQESAENTWSSSVDSDDIRVWKAATPEEISDGDLLEWWIEGASLLGIPEESWCDEDRTLEDPILTYWSGDDANEQDGSLIRFMIIANPTNALVEINGELTSSITIRRGMKLEYKVYDPTGEYITQTGSVAPIDNTVLTISLMKAIPTYTLTVKAIPVTSKVYISTMPLDSVDLSSVDTSIGLMQKTVEENTTLYWKVSQDGYESQFGSAEMTKDFVQEVELKAIPKYTFAISATPSNATVTINDEVTDSVILETGSQVVWTVSAPNYVTQSGTEILSKDVNLTVDLELIKRTITLSYSPEIAATINCSAISGTLISNTRPNDTSASTIVAYHGSEIKYTITPKSSTDYLVTSGSFIADTNKTVKVGLNGIPYYTFTINPVPADANVTINGTSRQTITVKSGTSVSWSVSATNYIAQSGTEVVNSNISKTVTLKQEVKYLCYTSGGLYFYVEKDATVGDYIGGNKAGAVEVGSTLMLPDANCTTPASSSLDLLGIVNLAPTSMAELTYMTIASINASTMTYKYTSGSDYHTRTCTRNAQYDLYS